MLVFAATGVILFIPATLILLLMGLPLVAIYPVSLFVLFGAIVYLAGSRVWSVRLDDEVIIVADIFRRKCKLAWREITAFENERTHSTMRTFLADLPTAQLLGLSARYVC